MLKENAKVFRNLLILGDIIVLGVSFILAYILRTGFDSAHPFNVYLLLMAMVVAVWLIMLFFNGIYTSFRTKTIPSLIYLIFKSALFSFLVFNSFTYLLKIQDVSRFIIISFFIIALCFLTIEKIVIILVLRYIRLKGYNYRSLLVVGTGKRARDFIGLVDKHSEWGLRIIGLVDMEREKIGQKISGYEVLGTFKDFPVILSRKVIDEVVFVVPRSWLDHMERLITFCEERGLKVNLAVDHFNLKFARATQTQWHHFPLVTFDSAPDKIGQLFIKRFFDVLFSFCSLLFILPLLLTVSLIIKLTSKGPVFFKQIRCSLNGRKFELYKFRSMVTDAEQKLEELQRYNQMQGPVFKLDNDPRLTRIGRFLRKFSIDELPQLWNVLKGDMSLVGPRPPIPSEVDKYDNWHRRRLSMRPGITCIWQTNGRNKISDFKEWVNLDLKYIDSWSLWLDVKLLVKTIPVVLFGTGAK